MSGNGWNYEENMSNNAVGAYEEGYKPLGQITLEDLQSAGWEESKKFAIWLGKEGHFWWYEEHHTSPGFFNYTKFYSPNELVEEWKDASDERKQSLKEEFDNLKKKEISPEIKVKGVFAVYQRLKFQYMREFTGTIINDWVHLDNGGKKNSKGNSILWEKIGDPEIKHCGNNMRTDANKRRLEALKKRNEKLELKLKKERSEKRKEKKLEKLKKENEALAPSP